MTAYWNENDLFAAALLEALISERAIAPGHVDTRSIKEVKGSDLNGYEQCHFFAGIGGWSYALRLAGWPDSRPVWTGSCPCQPFSVAGRGAGVADARHLWPDFCRLIAECAPPTVFGEQVASKAGREWLAGVRADLEILDYAVGGADLCAAGAGAPHIRQRLYWVADTGHQQPGWSPTSYKAETGWPFGEPAGHCDAGRLAHTDGGFEGDCELQRGWEHGQFPENGSTYRLGHTDDARLEERSSQCGNNGAELATVERAGSGSGFWSQHDILHCTDGKARRIEPGSFPLAHGVSARMGRLRGYGNAIVPEIAAAFIAAYADGR